MEDFKTAFTRIAIDVIAPTLTKRKEGDFWLTYCQSSHLSNWKPAYERSWMRQKRCFATPRPKKRQKRYASSKMLSTALVFGCLRADWCGDMPNVQCGVNNVINDNAVVAEFLEHLDTGQLDGRLDGWIQVLRILPGASPG